MCFMTCMFFGVQGNFSCKLLTHFAFELFIHAYTLPKHTLHLLFIDVTFEHLVRVSWFSLYMVLITSNLWETTCKYPARYQELPW